jgi:hypothetical protein
MKNKINKKYVIIISIISLLVTLFLIILLNSKIIKNKDQSIDSKNIQINQWLVELWYIMEDWNSYEDYSNIVNSILLKNTQEELWDKFNEIIEYKNNIDRSFSNISKDFNLGFAVIDFEKIINEKEVYDTIKEIIKLNWTTRSNMLRNNLYFYIKEKYPNFTSKVNGNSFSELINSEDMKNYINYTDSISSNIIDWWVIVSDSLMQEINENLDNYKIMYDWLSNDDLYKIIYDDLVSEINVSLHWCKVIQDKAERDLCYEFDENQYPEDY